MMRKLSGTCARVVEDEDLIAVPYLFLTGHDGSALPDADRAAPRGTKRPPRVGGVRQVIGSAMLT